MGVYGGSMGVHGGGRMEVCMKDMQRAMEGAGSKARDTHHSFSQNSIQELLKGECGEDNTNDSMREVWTVL